ncbi:DNA cytosine methyltransferase [Bacillus subtilis]|uniref:DNA cytosine methyltransferase n=1 Tax=Bacillus subtilis TaxID=1423 RepID=UPI00119D7690|nr:DNA cytosine methyltransferase [Bacillus subtilis]MEC2234673.1 DNA cytosine methyltransferase [Bacillus subtilis]
MNVSEPGVFPDEFNFIVSASSAYKMIGNAVPPVMAWHIARAAYYTLSQKEQDISVLKNQTLTTY